MRPTPFDPLDALYTHIFSSVEDIEKVLEIFSVLLFAKPLRLLTSSALIEHFLGLRSGDLDITLIDLHSILDIPYVGEIRVLHRSVEDFLLDHTRSGEYHISERHAHADLARHLMKRIPQKVTLVDPGMSPLSFRVSPDSFTMLPHSEIAMLDQLSSVIFTVHCMQSYPTEELLNEFWNLKLFPFWTHFYAHFNAQLMYDLISLLDFFTWLKNHGSTKEGQTLHSHYMLSWDHYIRHSLTQLSLGPLESQYLVFFILPQIRNNYQARDIFAWDMFGSEYRSLINVYSTLRSFDDDGRYNCFLTKFFSDPKRSGRYYLGGDKYANFVIIFTKYIIRCASCSIGQDWERDLSCLSDLLSKASSSSTLATLLERLLRLIEVQKPDLSREAADIVKTYLNTAKSTSPYCYTGPHAEDTDIVATRHSELNDSREDSITPSSVHESNIGRHTGSTLANLKTPQFQEQTSTVEICSTSHKESPNSPPKHTLRLNRSICTKEAPSASTSQAPAHPSTPVVVTEPSLATPATPIVTTTNRGRGRQPPTRPTPNSGRGSPRARGRGRWL